MIIFEISKLETLEHKNYIAKMSLILVESLKGLMIFF